MDKRKGSVNPVNPKWFSLTPTILMKREIEEAMVSLYIAKNYNPLGGRQKDLMFIDLLPYL